MFFFLCFFFVFFVCFSQSINSGFPYLVPVFCLHPVWSHFLSVVSLLSLYHCLSHLLRISVEGSLVLAVPRLGKKTDNQALKIAVSKAVAPQTDLHVFILYLFKKKTYLIRKRVYFMTVIALIFFFVSMCNFCFLVFVFFFSCSLYTLQPYSNLGLQSFSRSYLIIQFVTTLQAVGQFMQSAPALTHGADKDALHTNLWTRTCRHVQIHSRGDGEKHTFPSITYCAQLLTFNHSLIQLPK